MFAEHINQATVDLWKATAKRGDENTVEEESVIQFYTLLKSDTHFGESYDFDGLVDVLLETIGLEN